LWTVRVAVGWAGILSARDPIELRAPVRGGRAEIDGVVSR